MNLKHVVLIESKLIGAFDIIRKTRNLTYIHFTFITSDLSAYRSKQEDFEKDLSYISRIIELPSSTDPEIVMPEILKLHELDPIHAVITLSDPFTEICSLVCAELKLNYASLHSIRLAKNKAKFRDHLELHHVSQPKFGTVRSFDEGLKVVAKIGYPVIVKPADGHGSYHTILVKNDSDLKKGLEDIFFLNNYGRSAKSNQEALIEEYIEGELVSVESLTVKNIHYPLGITDRILVQAPAFVEVGGSFPVHHKMENEILQTWKKCLDAIGFDFGPSQTELLVKEDQVYVVEVNARLPGGPVPEILSLALNTEIYNTVVLMHLGELIEIPVAKIYCANRAFYSMFSGTVQEIYKSPLATNPYVAKYSIIPKVTEKVNALQSNFDRLGFVICTSEDQQEATDRANKIFETTHISIVPSGDQFCDPQSLNDRASLLLPKFFTTTLIDDISASFSKLKGASSEKLLEIISDPYASFAERFTAGKIFAMIGDPRIDVMDPKMVYIPGTEIIKPFRIGLFPITNMEYKNFLEQTRYPCLPSSWEFGRFPFEKSNHPVYAITTQDAGEYVSWLSKVTKRKFRLPTEAEWEFAAAGNEEREFPWGSEFDKHKCNTLELGLLSTTPVGMFPLGASPFGVLDLAGNAGELVSNNYDSYPNGGYQEDYLNKNAESYYVAKGGCFMGFSDLTRWKGRYKAFPKNLFPMGFRLSEDI